jgi:creatinine amidohydrolase
MMSSSTPKWRRYEELRPDTLAAYVQTAPIAFWPLGLLEHHGWHLPIGLDGLKAERMCIKIAEKTGGVLLPTMWWGGGGGHGEFMWTHYQPIEAAASILENTLQQLITFGFRVIVLLAGHYPWKNLILDKHVPALQKENPDVLFLWGTEMDIGEDLHLPGDHAAREETSYGLYLLPEFVDMDALRPGRGKDVWPGGHAPDVEMQHLGVSMNPADPCFAQLGSDSGMGEDARTASAARGEAAVEQLVTHLASVIHAYLKEDS